MTFDRSLVNSISSIDIYTNEPCVCVWTLAASTMFHDSPKVVVVEEPGWTTMAFLTFRILCRQWISEGPQMLWQFRVCTRIHFLRFIGMDDGKAHTHHNHSNVIRTIYELVCTGSGFLTGHFFGTSPPKSYIWLRWESAVGCLNSRDTPIVIGKMGTLHVGSLVVAILVVTVTDPTSTPLRRRIRRDSIWSLGSLRRSSVGTEAFFQGMFFFWAKHMWFLLYEHAT